MEKFFYRFNGQIECPKIESVNDIFSVLHELGHKASRHRYLGDGFISIQDVKLECQAWAYARKCIKSKYYTKFDAFALGCVQTYNAQAEATWGEWLTKSEILTLFRLSSKSRKTKEKTDEKTK